LLKVIWMSAHLITQQQAETKTTSGLITINEHIVLNQDDLDKLLYLFLFIYKIYMVTKILQISLLLLMFK